MARSDRDCTGALWGRRSIFSANVVRLFLGCRLDVARIPQPTLTEVERRQCGHSAALPLVPILAVSAGIVTVLTVATDSIIDAGLQ